MIRRTDITPADILRKLSGGEVLPQRVSGGPPMADSERGEAGAAVSRIASDTPDNIRTVCTGCGNDTPIRLSALCACGGFVCEACQRIEPEGTCDHVSPFGDRDA